MAAPKIYGQIIPTADGVLLIQVHSVEKATQNKDQDVETLALGWNGITPGPKTSHVKIEAYLPSDGMEIDFDKIEQTNQFVTIGLVMIGGAKKEPIPGCQIRNVTVKSGVGQNSTVTFDVMGPPARFV